LFNEVALSPYTDLVDKTLAFVDALESQGSISFEGTIDFLGHMLRLLGRHLTAYDLVTFHHRGANYPDALFLDAVLKAYLKQVGRRPEAFLPARADAELARRAKRLRRRALRQGWLLRMRYEGHPVPDAPTSEGENARILPAPHLRVPEEQILQVHRRTKRLYSDDPLSDQLSSTVRDVLQQSVADLADADELRELGMALFLDRPLGIGKLPGEPDQTLLFSYVAFSRSAAERRLDYLATELKLMDAAAHEQKKIHLRELHLRGVAVESLRTPERPTPVSLADALRAAEDFLILRSTSRTVRDFLHQYNFQEIAKCLVLDFFAHEQPVLVLLGLGATDAERAAITVLDKQLQPRLRLHVDASQGYETRGGCEYPVCGLRVLQAWDADGREIHNTEGDSLRILPTT
jgi:hypothetical protein